MQAISYYENHIVHYGITFPVLTLLGDCYFRLGNTDEAVKAWEKSLEINPNQDQIKKLVDSLKKQSVP